MKFHRVNSILKFDLCSWGADRITLRRNPLNSSQRAVSLFQLFNSKIIPSLPPHLFQTREHTPLSPPLHLSTLRPSRLDLRRPFSSHLHPLPQTTLGFHRNLTVCSFSQLVEVHQNSCSATGGPIASTKMWFLLSSLSRA